MNYHYLEKIGYIKNSILLMLNILKENYFLDEITAKFLSIRNIKKDYIKSFLEPSIKNLIPNPNTLRDMEKTTKDY